MFVYDGGSYYGRSITDKVVEGTEGVARRAPRIEDFFIPGAQESFMKTYVQRLVIAAALVSSVGYTAQTVQAGDGEWWVVLGSIPTPDNNFTPQVEAAVRRIEAAARRCGLKPFHDFSSKFRGFATGYTVVVVGAYASKASAERMSIEAASCLPGAYVKQGSYAGE